MATGESLYYSYTNWDEDEPSNSNYGENCLEMLAGNRLWNDVSCYGQYGADRRSICQLFF